MSCSTYMLVLRKHRYSWDLMCTKPALPIGSVPPYFSICRHTTRVKRMQRTGPNPLPHCEGPERAALHPVWPLEPANHLFHCGRLVFAHCDQLSFITIWLPENADSKEECPRMERWLFEGNQVQFPAPVWGQLSITPIWYSLASTGTRPAHTTYKPIVHPTK